MVELSPDCAVDQRVVPPLTTQRNKTPEQMTAAAVGTWQSARTSCSMVLVCTKAGFVASVLVFLLRLQKFLPKQAAMRAFARLLAALGRMHGCRALSDTMV
jgi:hypothetical protein